jgi:hypothetical protein
MDEKSEKCQFCAADATSIYRLFVVTSPDAPQGSLHYDYVGDAVYTCDRHTLSVQGFLLHGTEEKG